MSEKTEFRELPLGWSTAKVEDIIHIIDYRGRTPPYSLAGIPHLRSSNIKNGKVVWEGLRYVSKETYEKYMTRGLPQKGDLLFTTEAPLGEVALAPEQEFSIAQRIMLLRPTKAFAPLFLLYLVRSEGFQRSLLGRGTGTTVTGVSSRNFKPLVIIVPPLPEQYRIVAKIEELFTKLDAGVDGLRKAKAQLKRYRQAVLKAAVTGELTKEWREAHQGELEPASVLLARILNERRAKWEADQLAKMKDIGKILKNDEWKRKYIEPAAPKSDGLQELPNSWIWTSLEQLSDEARAITYGVIKLGNYVEDGVPVLRSSDVRHLRLDLHGVKKISPTIASDYKRTFLRGAEVLVNVRGTLGGIVSVPAACAGYNISREVAMIALVEENMGRSLAFLISSPPMQNWLLRNTKGIAYTGINIETLKAMPVPLPSLLEQQRIVEEVERLLSIADAMEQTIEQSLKQAERLRQSILKQAFAGKLVPQDAGDEPAEMLLARIREEREKRDAAKPKKASPRGRRKDTGKQIELLKGAAN